MPKPENIKGKGFDKHPENRNNKGRPPVLPELKTAIAKLLSEKSGDYTALDAILKALFKRALSGDVRAAQELLDRGFGKSQQLVDMTTNGEKINTFKIEVTNQQTAEKLNKWLNEND